MGYPPLRRTTAPPLEMKLLQDEAKAQTLIAWIYPNFYDVRTFGAAMTISRANCAHLRGSVPAHSIH